MTQPYKTPPFLRALQALLPDARLTITSLRDWRSMTFNGQQLFLSLRLEGEDAPQRARQFAAMLPEHEFGIARQIVADATVVSTRQDGDVVTMTVEALILDE